MKFPLKGLLPTIGILICSILTIWIGINLLGYDAGIVSIYTLFATWFAFILSTGGGWPIEGVPQPYRGFIFLIICLAYGFLHMWAQPVVFGFSAKYYWPAIANLFLAIGITISLDNKLVEGLKQPVALIMNILFWYLFAFLLLYIIPVNNGMVPSIWFAWFVFLFFWMDRYPISDLPQPAKSVLSFAIMAGAGIFLNYIFKWFFHTTFFQPDAGTWFAVWVFWLVLSSWVFDTWPFQDVKQPTKGIIGLVLTVVLASVTYYIIAYVAKVNLQDAVGYAWIFVSWVYMWPICLGKWPARENAGQ